MELHDHLYALGLQLGREVFDDPDGFRGALDDYLDEDAATTGDINLLVDAVRLGAFRSLATILDSGADPTRAIEEAGGRLARDRGSADVAGAQWACAVLGFAIGKVSDADVRRYRTQHPPTGAARPAPVPTVLPTTPPAAPPAAPPVPPPAGPTQVGGRQSGGPPAAAPTQVGGAPAPHAPPQQGWPQAATGAAPGAQPFAGSPGGPSSWGAPDAGAAGRKRRAWPIVVAVAAVLAVIAGVLGVVLLTGDDDDKDDPAGPGGGPGTEEVSYDAAAVDERYAGLAEAVTSGTEGCDGATVQAGQTERVECRFSGGTLVLTTYEDMSELEAGRKRDVTLARGSLFEATPTGQFAAFRETTDTGEALRASLYWDHEESLTAAKYNVAAEVDHEELRRTFEATRPSIEFPTAPSDPELIDFADDWIPVDRCERIFTLAEDETEESSCPDIRGVDVYIAKFENLQALRKYRKLKLGLAREDNRALRTWNQAEGEPTIGALYEYVTDVDPVSTVRYWDMPDCFCYMEAYLDGEDYETLMTWWVDG